MCCLDLNCGYFFSNRDNPVVCIVLVVLVSLYAVLLVFCNHADAQLEKNSGTFLLPDNNPSDHFLYAVTIDTDIRSRARMTAKVLTKACSLRKIEYIQHILKMQLGPKCLQNIFFILISPYLIIPMIHSSCLFFTIIRQIPTKERDG